MQATLLRNARFAARAMLRNYVSEGFAEKPHPTPVRSIMCVHVIQRRQERPDYLFFRRFSLIARIHQNVRKAKELKHPFREPFIAVRGEPKLA
jgi:hypothetical protein